VAEPPTGVNVTPVQFMNRLVADTMETPHEVAGGTVEPRI
jgi:hypothetical protein